MPRVALLAATSVLLVGCSTSNHSGPAITTPKAPSSSHLTTPAKPRPTVERDGQCPLLTAEGAATEVGVRLGRISVLYVGKHPIGCRFYADQDPPFKASEHLPGPNQPVLEISSVGYPAPTTAHNALVRVATAGTDAYAANLSASIEGVSFRTPFYPADHAKDWAYAFRVNRTVVVVKTIQTDTSFDARAVAGDIAAKFN